MYIPLVHFPPHAQMVNREPIAKKTGTPQSQPGFIHLVHELMQEACIAASVEKKDFLEPRHFRLALRMKAPCAHPTLFTR